jgi:hypothetical protein
VVQDGEIIIVDEFTGRLMTGRWRFCSCFGAGCMSGLKPPTYKFFDH